MSASMISCLRVFVISWCLAGGVLLERMIGKRPKKVLGVTIPRRQAHFSDVARSINAAGKQFGKLAGEVRVARQKAEDIGKALS